MGRDDRSQEESGKKKRYTPPRFAHLTPEQARAVPVAKDLQDGPVVKQLLEWIAELENRLNFWIELYTDLAKRLFWIGVHLTNRTTPSVGESIGCVRMLRLWDRCDLYGDIAWRIHS